MKNQIIKTNKSIEELRREYLGENIFWVEVDGDKIRDEEKYVRYMKDAFCISVEFPKMVVGWLNDYLCDLSWIEKEAIVIVFENYKSFLSSNTKKKKDIMLDFEEIILPWWESEVEQHMVGGKARSFQVYLID